jgi:hypothetical protein
VIENPKCDDKNEILTFGISKGTSREMNNAKGYFRNEVLHDMTFVATEVKHEIFVLSGGANKEDCKGPLIREVFLELNPNLVKDHRFMVLGPADSSAQGLAWEVKPYALGSGAVDGPRTDGEYDVYLEAGQELTQEISGLTGNQKYLMRIQVFANPECIGNEQIWFGPKENFHKFEIIRSTDEGFATKDYHQYEFYTGPGTTEVKIFVASKGTGSIAKGKKDVGLGLKCKGPRIRKVLLNAV